MSVKPGDDHIYLFVMLLWAKKLDRDVPSELAALRDRRMQRPAVQTAMKHEGIRECD